MSDALLETRSYQIVSSMKDNTNFTAPVPTVAQVEQMASDFFDALSLCADGSRLNIAIKNQKREVLINALHQWSRYVLFTSNDDVSVALTSGFQIAKASGPTPPLTKPETPSLQNGIKMSRGVFAAFAGRNNNKIRYQFYSRTIFKVLLYVLYQLRMMLQYAVIHYKQ